MIATMVILYAIAAICILVFMFGAANDFRSGPARDAAVIGLPCAAVAKLIEIFAS